MLRFLFFTIFIRPKLSVSESSFPSNLFYPTVLPLIKCSNKMLPSFFQSVNHQHLALCDLFCSLSRGSHMCWGKANSGLGAAAQLSSPLTMMCLSPHSGYKKLLQNEGHCQKAHAIQIITKHEEQMCVLLRQCPGNTVQGQKTKSSCSPLSRKPTSEMLKSNPEISFVDHSPK